MVMYSTIEVDGVRKEEEYHLGDRLRVDFLNVVDLYADGHELEYIVSHFEGLLLDRSKRSMTWVGDHARTIYANLYWK